MKKASPRSGLLAHVVIALLLTGCSLSENIQKVNQWVGFELFKYKPKTLPQEVKDEMNSVATPEPGASVSSAMARANSELLSEMMKVVFNEEQVEDRSEFGSLAHSLNQGASLEGIYRGLVMGSRYRGLESSTQAASPKVLKVFVMEMVELQQTMKSPTEFVVGESKLAPNIEFPDGKLDHEVKAKADNQEVKAKKPKREAVDELLQIFIGASQFTLKRVLAEEALKKIDELKDSPGELAQWYAQFAVQMAKTPVDFGLEQRKQDSFDFHFSFAHKMAPDRVKWEVLNRYHRYLNYAIQHER